MNIKNLYLVASMAVAGLAFTACSHSDYIDENAAENNQKALYADNFVKKYGPIDPNQTWDFSTSETHYYLPSSGKAARTRGGEGYSFEGDNVNKGTIEVEKAVLEWMYTNMPKGQDNQVQGRAFKMVVPNNSFTIAPIYQGCASYYWQLWMHVDGIGDYKIWEKGNDFYYKETETSTTWTPLDYGKDGLAKDNNGEFPYYAVQSPATTFNNLPAGKDMTFYLKVWKTDSKHTLGYYTYQDYLETPALYPPTTISSIDKKCKMISLLNAKKPAAVEEGYEVTIIGCEDDKDNDFEDLVFMVYGKPVPPTERVEVVESCNEKRYLMEDLGATDDFDFNDVVVDVQFNRQKVTTIYDNTTGDPISEKTETLPDIAYVRAAGGTLDFTLTIGTTTWTKSEYMDVELMWNTGWGGTEINTNDYIGEPFEVEGFIPGDNNISVSVVGRGNNVDVKKDVTKIAFPKKGEAPMMIAIDPNTFDWMPERVNIPTGWWYEED